MTDESALHAEINRLRDAYHHTRTLLDISRHVTNAQDRTDLLYALAQHAISQGATSAVLMMTQLSLTGDPVALEVSAYWNPDEPHRISPGTRYAMEAFPLSQTLIETPQSPLAITDAEIDQRLDDAGREHLREAGLAAVILLPIIYNGRWISLVQFGWPTSHIPVPDEMALYSALPEIAAPAVDHLRLMAELEHMVVRRTVELERLLDNVGDAIISVGLDGVIHSWNPAAERIYGWPRKDVLGKPAGSLVSDDWETEIFQPTLAGQTVERVVELTHRDGTPLTIRLRTSLVHDEHGHPESVAVVASDISAMKQAEDERARMQQEIIDTQQRAIHDLSSPIIPIINGIIVAPLIGHIDSERARDIMRGMLAAITEHRAEVLLIDITGVPLVDSAVANALNSAVRAAQLKGARTILTGISPAVAETIVEIGIDWTELETLRDLETGLLAALKLMRIRLIKESPS